MSSANGKRARRLPNHRAVGQSAIGLDQQLSELMELVYAWERRSSAQDRIDA
jgi:hypothetical protein